MSYIVPEVQIKEMLSLIRTIVMGYFEEGDMPIEQAYARASIIEAYLERIGGDDKFSYLLNEYEDNHEKDFIIFPDEAVLEKLAFDICSTEDFIKENDVSCNVFKTIANEYNTKPPYLKLVVNNTNNHENKTHGPFTP